MEGVRVAEQEGVIFQDVGQWGCYGVDPWDKPRGDVFLLAAVMVEWV